MLWPISESVDRGVNLARARARVATAKEAVMFCKKLEAAMTQLRTLLCYPVSEVVENTIAVLTLCE